MERDLLGIAIEHARDGIAGEAWDLGATPELGGLSVDAHGGVHRFHRRVREIGGLVARLDHLRGGLEHLDRIPDLPEGEPVVRLGDLAERTLNRRGVERGVR